MRELNKRGQCLCGLCILGRLMGYKPAVPEKPALAGTFKRPQLIEDEANV